MRKFANIPNLLTLARLVVAPFVIWAIIQEMHRLALVLFTTAALTDGIDGALARRYHQITAMGAYFDPIADKVLLSGVFVSLALVGSVPWWLVAVIFGRDIFLLFVSAVALLFTKFRQFRPSVWGKASTLLQIACATVWMAQNAVDFRPLHALAEALIWPTAAATIWSGVHYGWRGLRFAWTH